MSNKGNPTISVAIKMPDLDSFIAKTETKISKLENLSVDFGLADSFKQEINNIKDMMEGFKKSLSSIANQRVSSATYNKFTRDVTKQIESLNERTSILETNLDSVIKMMDQNSGNKLSSSFKDLKNSINETNTAAEGMVSTLEAVEKFGGVKIDVEISKDQLKQAQDLLDAIKEIREDLNKDDIDFSFGKKIDDKKLSETEDRLKELARTFIDVRKELSKAPVASTEYDNLTRSLADTSREITEIYAGLQNLVSRGSKGAEQLLDKKMFDFTKNGKLVKSNLTQLTTYVLGQFNSLEKGLQSQIDRINDTINDVGDVKRKDSNDWGKGLTVPMKLGTSETNLKKQVTTLLDAVRPWAEQQHLDISISLVTEWGTRKNKKLLQDFQDQINKSADQIDVKALQNLRDQIEKSFNDQIVLKIESNIDKEKINVIDGINEIRTEIKREPFNIDIDLSNEKKKELQETLNKIVNGVTVTIKKIKFDKNLSSSKKDKLGLSDKQIDGFIKKLEELQEKLIKIPDSLNDIIGILQKGFNLTPFEELDNMFTEIQKKAQGITGKLSTKDNKKELKELLDLYTQYRDLGGTRGTSEFGGLDKVSSNIAKEYNNIARPVSKDNHSKSLGNDFGVGYAEGIREVIDIVEKAAIEMTNAAINAVKKTQDSNSPSEVARQLGKYWGEGYAKGILQSSKDVKNAVRALVEEGKLTLTDLAKDTTHKDISDQVYEDVTTKKKPVKEVKTYQNRIKEVDIAPEIIDIEAKKNKLAELQKQLDNYDKALRRYEKKANGDAKEYNRLQDNYLKRTKMDPRAIHSEIQQLNQDIKSLESTRDAKLEEEKNKTKEVVDALKQGEKQQAQVKQETSKIAEKANNEGIASKKKVIKATEKQIKAEKDLKQTKFETAKQPVIKEIDKAEEEVNRFLNLIKFIDGSKVYKGIENVDEKITEISASIRKGSLNAAEAFETFTKYSTFKPGGVSNQVDIPELENQNQFMGKTKEELEECLRSEEKWLSRCKEGSKAYEKRKNNIEEISSLLNKQTNTNQAKENEQLREHTELTIKDTEAQKENQKTKQKAPKQQKQYQSEKKAIQEFEKAFNKYFDLYNQYMSLAEKHPNKAAGISGQLRNLMQQFPTLNRIGNQNKSDIDYQKELNAFLETQTALQKKKTEASKESKKAVQEEVKAQKELTKEEQKSEKSSRSKKKVQDLKEEEVQTKAVTKAKKEQVKADKEVEKQSKNKEKQFKTEKNAIDGFTKAYNKLFDIQNKRKGKISDAEEKRLTGQKSELLKQYPTLKGIGRKKKEDVDYDAELKKFLATQTALNKAEKESANQKDISTKKSKEATKAAQEEVKTQKEVEKTKSKRKKDTTSEKAAKGAKKEADALDEVNSSAKGAGKSLDNFTESNEKAEKSTNKTASSAGKASGKKKRSTKNPFAHGGIKPFLDPVEDRNEWIGAENAAESYKDELQEIVKIDRNVRGKAVSYRVFGANGQGITLGRSSKKDLTKQSSWGWLNSNQTILNKMKKWRDRQKQLQEMQQWDDEEPLRDSYIRALDQEKAYNQERIDSEKQYNALKKEGQKQALDELKKRREYEKQYERDYLNAERERIKEQNEANRNAISSGKVGSSVQRQYNKFLPLKQEIESNTVLTEKFGQRVQEIDDMFRQTQNDADALKYVSDQYVDLRDNVKLYKQEQSKAAKAEQDAVSSIEKGYEAQRKASQQKKDNKKVSDTKEINKLLAEQEQAYKDILTAQKEIERLDKTKNKKSLEEQIKNKSKAQVKYLESEKALKTFDKDLVEQQKPKNYLTTTRAEVESKYALSNAKAIDTENLKKANDEYTKIKKRLKEIADLQEENLKLSSGTAKGDNTRSIETNEQRIADLRVQNAESARTIVSLDAKEAEQNKEILELIQKQNFEREQTSNDVRKDDISQINEWIGKLKELENSGKYTEKFKEELSGAAKKFREIAEAADTVDLETLNKQTKQLGEEFKELSGKKALKDLQVAAQSSLEKLRNKIARIMEDNTAMGRKFKEQFENLEIRLSGGEKSKAEIEQITAEIFRLDTALDKAGKKGKSFFDTFKERLTGANAQFLARYFSFQDILRYARTAFESICELDTALVDLKKTTTMSAQELDKFYFSSNDVAKSLGTTTAEIINQAAAWSRLGYSTNEEATAMAKLSAQFAAISPGMDLEKSTDGLVSSMKAFGIQVDDVQRSIMDNINRIGNTMATSNDEIVDMLTRSSAAMNAANNTIEQTIALESAAVQITRNAETTGTAFRTISMRIKYSPPVWRHAGKLLA